MKTRIFQLVFTLSFTVFTNTIGWAQDTPNLKPSKKEFPIEQLLSVANDSIPDKELKQIETDSITNDSLQKPKGLLDGTITYKATDYTSINQKTKQIYLYNEA